MKEKIKTFLAVNKGGISLFAIVLAVTVITTAVCGLCGAGNSSRAIAGGCIGTLALMGINYAAASVGMKLGDTDHPGIVGIVIGVLVSLI